MTTALYIGVSLWGMLIAYFAIGFLFPPKPKRRSSVRPSPIYTETFRRYMAEVRTYERQGIRRNR